MAILNSPWKHRPNQTPTATTTATVTPATAPVPATELPIETQSTWHSLRAYPHFRMLLIGTTATNSAFWMYQIAVGWLALQMTDSPFFVGLTGFAGGIPLLILSIPVGVVVDRVDKRTILLLAQAGVMVTSAVFALLVGFDLIERWSILVLAAIYGSVMSFVFPTRTTMVPSLVARADLTNALALNAAGQNATRVIGPSLAGILIAVFGVTGTFAAGALMQVLALYSTWHLPKRAENHQSRPTAQPGNLTLGFRIVARDPFMLSIILMALATNVLVMPYLNLMPVFARDELDLGSTGLGVLLASAGLGTVAGALLVARSALLTRWPKAQLATSLAFCVLVMIFAVTPMAWAAALLLFLAGMVSAAFLALNQTSLQMRVDDNVRGRVFSIYLMTWGVLPIGQLTVGALADLIGSPLAVVIACVVSLVSIGYISRRYAAPKHEHSTI